jgi:hypothetical protein
MPVIKIPGPYEFGFFSNENAEPSHVHVSREEKECKFWIGPVRLAKNWGFAGHELRKIEKLVRSHEDEIQAVWDDHFAK